MEENTETQQTGLYGPRGWSERDERLRELLKEKAKKAPILGQIFFGLDQNENDHEQDELPQFMRLELDTDEAKIVLERLEEIAPENLTDTQNVSPTLQELLTCAIELNAQLNMPVTVDGYYVGKSRSDERITIDGICFHYQDADATELKQLLQVIANMHNADNVSNDNGKFSIWWD